MTGWAEDTAGLVQALPRVLRDRFLRDVVSEALADKPVCVNHACRFERPQLLVEIDRLREELARAKADLARIDAALD